MRMFAIAAVAALIAAPAFASPASVSVVVGPKLQEKAVRTLGVRDVDDLAKDLQKTVENRLAKTGAYQNARIELVLVDAIPNRPTFKQLGDTPGLSLSSFGVGGARIEGRAIASDGVVTPLSYDYMEPDIRWVRGYATWSNAEQTFEQFAAELGRGKAPKAR